MNESRTAIRVCALVPYPPGTTPSQRFRIEQWMPFLAEQDIAIDLLPFADAALLKVLHRPGHWAAKTRASAAAFLRRVAQVATARRYDAVLIHRAACLAGPALLERALKIFRRPVIFDFDDAIYLLHTTEANRRIGWLKFPRKTQAICRLSDHVIAGNLFLAEYALQYNRRVTVIPSSVDTERFHPPANRSANGKVVVGWTGSSTSQTYLEKFASVLGDLVSRRDVELRIHSDREPALSEIPFEWHPWSPDTEAEEIAAFDIGIMPMPDEPWAYGKCAMKALLYMASGVPAVCEGIGANRDVIRHGENGFLATTPKEWLALIEKLVDNPSLREHLALAGRRTVEEQYSMHRCAEQFALVIREAVQK